MGIVRLHGTWPPTLWLHLCVDDPGPPLGSDGARVWPLVHLLRRWPQARLPGRSGPHAIGTEPRLLADEAHAVDLQHVRLCRRHACPLSGCGAPPASLSNGVTTGAAPPSMGSSGLRARCAAPPVAYGASAKAATRSSRSTLRGGSAAACALGSEVGRRLGRSSASGGARRAGAPRPAARCAPCPPPPSSAPWSARAGSAAATGSARPAAARRAAPSPPRSLRAWLPAPARMARQARTLPTQSLSSVHRFSGGSFSAGCGSAWRGWRDIVLPAGSGPGGEEEACICVPVAM